MLKSKTRWLVQETDEQKVNKLVDELNVPSLVAKLLINRDLDDVEQARNFLFDTGEPFHDPFLFNDMQKAVDRIKKGIQNKEKILIFGDYDADGVSSTSVMMTVLRDLHADVAFYIPNRFSEGYGPNEQAFRWAKDSGFSLIITVDTGISAIHEAIIAKDLEIDLIITDHHEPGPELPEALAIIHPKLAGSTYPFSDLAGVGVAFKLAHALYGYLPEELLDLAAIGTIADLVPLVGENRAIAKKGLLQLRKSNRLGIKALCKLAKANQKELNEESIGFAIAPRINAVGRLGDADPGVDLLLCQDEEEAMLIASEIDSINKERQAIVSEMTEEAVKMVEDDFPLTENQVLVIGKEGWNSGVVGIVASRLVDKFYRPTIVLSYDKETGKAKGSARSIVGFDLFQNLSTCRDILPHFGGHPMAAGMTLELDNVSELRGRLNELASKQLSEEDFIPITQLDTEIKLEEIDLSGIEQLQMLSPFGMANPKPKLKIANVNINNLKKIGASQNHLKLTLEEEDNILDGVGFGLGEIADHVSPISKVSVIGELSINEWNNRRKPQIFLQDIMVTEWQLFDVRGIKHIERWLPMVPSVNRKIVCFDTLTPHQFQTIASEKVEVIDTLEKAMKVDIASQHIVLLDLPSDKKLLESLIENGKPSRIYAHFHQNEDHFFTTMPTRDHFKWYYAFLAKRKSFHIEKHGNELAKYKGWSRETIDFMSKVFFELEFVTMNNGFISLNPIKTKRDLSESPTYQKKQSHYTLENDLVYSSYQELKAWFDERIVGSVTARGGVEAWI